MTYYRFSNGEVHDFNHTPFDETAERLTNAEGKRARAAYAQSELRKLLPPGSLVNCILRHRSASGMSRRISVLAGTRDITRLAADAGGFTISRADRDSIVMSGCGMDMGFALVYSLSHSLYPKGFGILGTTPSGRKVRPSSAAGAAQAVRRGTVFRGRNGDASGWDTDGGYALRHNWL